MAILPMNAPPGYQTLQEVVNIQNNLLDAISGQMHSGSRSQEELAQVIAHVRDIEIQKLRELQRAYLAREAQMFADLRLEGSTPEQKLNNFKTKVDKWNSSNASGLLRDNNAIVKKIAESIQPAGRLELEVLLKAVEQIKIEHPDVLLRALFQDEIDDLGINLSNEVVDSLVATTFGGGNSRRGTLALDLSLNKSGNLSSKIGNGFTLHTTKLMKSIGVRVIDNGKRIRISFTGDMNNDGRNALAERLSQYIEQQSGGKSSVAVDISSRLARARTIIMDGIRAMMPADAVTTNVSAKVEEVVRNYVLSGRDIALSDNTAVVRGALGEIYWTAFFQYIGLPAIPVGFNYLTENKKQLPIDILVGNTGFQVKNYAIEESAEGDLLTYFNSYQRFDKEQGMVVREPAKQPLTQILSAIGNSNVQTFGSFFFSRAYNKEQMLSPNHEKFTPVEARFPSITDTFMSYVELNAASLLGLNRKVTEVINKTGTAQVNAVAASYPMIYFIKDKFILASTMIENIINSMSGTADPNAIAVKVTNVAVHAEDMAEDGQWPYEPTKDYSSYLSSVEVSYYIEVNLSRLMAQMGLS